VVTRALGAHLVLPVEISPLKRAGFEYSPREVLLLCSDGISGVVNPSHTVRIIEKAGNQLSNAVEKLLVEVERRHGNDDASVVLVMPDCGGEAPAASRVLPPPPPPPRAPAAALQSPKKPGSIPPPPPPRVTASPPVAPTKPASPKAPPPAAPKKSAAPPPKPPAPRPTLEPPPVNVAAPKTTASIKKSAPPAPSPKPAPKPEPKPKPKPKPKPEQPAAPKKRAAAEPDFPPEPTTIQDEVEDEGLRPEPDTDEYDYEDDDLESSSRRSWVIPALIVVMVLFGGAAVATVVGWFIVNNPTEETPAVTQRPVAPVVMPATPPVWIDARGDAFRVGMADPCPDGVWCLGDIGLAGDPVKPLATLDGKQTAGNTGTRLERFLDSSRFLMDASDAVNAWHPSRSGTFEPACSRLFPDERPWIGGLGPGAAGLQPPSGTSVPAAGYRMSSLAADLVGACAVGSRSWQQLMGSLLSPEQPVPANPASDLYRRRLAEGLELALLSSSMPEADELRIALETIGADPIAVRLPSDPLVAFDGKGSFAMGSGFRRELGALATLAGEEPSIVLELCVVASPAVGRTRKTGPQWDGERLGYLGQAIVESGAEAHIKACEAALEPVTLTDEELLTCGALVAPVASQGLLLVSAR